MGEILLRVQANKGVPYFFCPCNAPWLPLFRKRTGIFRALQNIGFLRWNNLLQDKNSKKESKKRYLQAAKLARLLPIIHITWSLTAE